jgi:hypothetical protein
LAGRLSIDVTRSVQAWASNPSTNFGWAILPTGDNGVDFYSAEGAVPPRLVVAYRSGQPMAGDVNLDGTVNGLDVDPFVDRLLNGPYQTQADMNGDGLINGLDVNPFVATVVGSESAANYAIAAPMSTSLATTSSPADRGTANRALGSGSHRARRERVDTDSREVRSLHEPAHNWHRLADQALRGERTWLRRT